jgi:hypothetical protein
LRLANTQWFNQIAYGDFTFNFTTEEQVPQILCRLQQYTSPIGITFHRPKCTLKKQHFEEIGRLTHLTKLNIEGKMIADITENEDMAPLTRLTNLKEANDLPSSITTRLANLKNITVSYSKSLDLSKFTQLESVIINSPFAFDTLCIIPHTQRITKLVSDTYSMREVPGGAAFFSFDEISTRYPRLKTLCYTNGNAENEDFTFPYLPSLESIDVTVTHVCSLAALHETLTSLTLFCRTIDCPPLAALTNLRKLSIQLRSKNLTADDMQFLITLTNLEYLKLRPRDPSIGNWIETAQYITSDKMTALLLYGEQRVDYITKFSNLKELGVGEFVPPGHYPGIGNFPYLTKLRFNENIYVHRINNNAKKTAIQWRILCPSRQRDFERRKIERTGAHQLQQRRKTQRPDRYLRNSALTFEVLLCVMGSRPISRKCIEHNNTGKDTSV